ncbi:hypothetical protein A2856_03715 [Candidatus Uhrbacteria bacterium RIFCSPHIGHO2_01_FULL_63_20]|uniref:Uncharacterized protein n=1 Tax=Candidatus Uhrbacteria bacterium RIFCSPHIGHO2_01_FULL_63_20 TaxID=1802385 RepID=A0A1F7TNQ7_9BACT|nr:MAG: hypothetical protein A2856_03715 [Candidatus Uhrbacteria bacterium RIFCSPHIGHO2_01_FULL_63_20]
MYDPYGPTPIVTPQARKPFILAVVVLALFAAALAGAWYLYSARQQAKEEAREEARQAMDEARLNASSCEAGNAGCETVKVGEVARRTGSPEACRLLVGAAFDDCVWGVALATDDPSLCPSIADAGDRETCADGIYETLGVRGDASACASIADATRRARCEQGSVGIITSQNCDQKGKPAAYCADVAQAEKAVANRDPSLCGSVSDAALQEGCFDTVGPGDVDGDGLNADDEAAYGTSDANPDTDGDGFKDGDEVNGGYDPNGPGKL